MPTFEFASLLMAMGATVVGLAASLRQLSAKLNEVSHDLCDVRAELARVVSEYETCQVTLRSLRDRPWWLRWLPVRVYSLPRT